MSDTDWLLVYAFKKILVGKLWENMKHFSQKTNDHSLCFFVLFNSKMICKYFEEFVNKNEQFTTYNQFVASEPPKYSRFTIFFTRFCLFVLSKIRMNHFLYWEGWVIPTFSKSWRHLKMYFPDSLKKIKKKIWLKRNIRKLRIFWWFRCHECINSLAASIHDLILQFFRSLWTYTRLYLGYS